MLETHIEGRPLAPSRLVTVGRTVPTVVAHAATAFPSSVALTDGRRSWLFDDLPSLSARVAGHLTGLGLGHGDRVIAAAANRSELLELYLGCAWMGAVFVPLNPETPEAQIGDLITYLEPAAVFTDAACLPAWSRAFPGTQRMDDSGVAAWDDAPECVVWPKHQPSTTVTILMTSGTTGRSKGVECPSGQFIQWGESVGELLWIGSDDVVYTCLPLFHTNALNAFMQTLIAGARFHIGQRFSVSRFFEHLVEAEATVTYLLGAMVGMLLTRPEAAIDREHRVTRILAPGTPIPSLHAFEQRFGALLVEGHGMTETNLVIAPPPGERRLGFMGTPVPGFEVRVVDEEGAPMKAGIIGELEMRTDIACAFANGYWRLPDHSRDAYREGWFRTGDRVVEEDGWYRFIDRSKDVIRRRGENISAFEVEQAIESVPAVSRSAVIPVPAELGEDEVMAFVVLAPGALTTEEDVAAAVAERLPRYAVPRYVAFVDDLPLTDTGKVRKQELRDRGIGPDTWDRTPAGR